MYMRRIEEHKFGDYCNKFSIRYGKSAFWFLCYRQIGVHRTSVKRVLESLKSYVFAVYGRRVIFCNNLMRKSSAIIIFNALISE